MALGDRIVGLITTYANTYPHLTDKVADTLLTDAGLMKQTGRNQQAAQAQAGQNNYDRAYAACMQGRGYQVR